RCGTSFVNDEGIATESRWGLLGTSIIGSQDYDHKILANLEIESPGQEDQKMHVDLDNLKLLAKIDPSNMVGAVGRFPDVFLRSRDEWDVSLKTRSSIQNVVLMGMGGSASAADVVLDWLKAALTFPALLHQGPGLP